jgi:hypothetical protein
MSQTGDWGDELVAVDAASGAPQLYYATLEDFVCEQLVPMYRRALEGQHRTWCPEWWRHAEAISRLEAIWRAWEHLRLDPTTGVSVWFRDHADPHMTVLLDSDGPFKRCRTASGYRHQPLDPLPLTPPPRGLFAPEDAEG